MGESVCHDEYAIFMFGRQEGIYVKPGLGVTMPRGFFDIVASELAGYFETTPDNHITYVVYKTIYNTPIFQFAVYFHDTVCRLTDKESDIEVMFENATVKWLRAAAASMCAQRDKAT